MVKKIFSALISAAALVGASTLAHADLVNPGFETGTFFGWTTGGGGSAAVISTTPSAGNPVGGSDMWGGAPGDSGSFMAALANGENLQFASQAASPTSTDLFLWLNFMTLEVASPTNPFNDLVTAVLATTSGPVLYSLDVNSNTSFIGGHNLASSGWVPFLIPAGTTFLDVTVANVGDNNVESFSLVDITTVIPEPEIYAMMGIGLALMGFVARRRKGQAAAA